ncbi:hypothetical protein KSC_063320 [Ktedonobacter sp. SOSP1-52]|uniref:hypothetical protein n=1 Tax=Ktedonobacter sp. SOSP1-52 TaxID=2778366 RepID=UPI001916410F|nr:hypothetical protein [Ktedonobacter sp. SOSP1-52]GHO67440.1 hypothetical protein KSC_063320 [Ktedonobacter sp. SOSP1-52]
MTTPLQGQQFNPEEEKILEEMTTHWRSVWNAAPVQALTRIEDAAKQMIMVTTGLQGLYVTLVVFSTIHVQIMVAPGGLPGVIILPLFCSPVLCWLVSLFYATRVFVPRIQPGIDFNEISVSAWRKVKETYGRANEEKLRWLQFSHRWLIASFIFVLLSIVVFLVLPSPPATPTEPTRIIILTPTPQP